MLTWSLPTVEAGPGQTFLPVGAQAGAEGTVYRVWAPKHETVRVIVGMPNTDTRYVPLERDPDGFFTGRDEHGRAGDNYWFQLGERLTPDPASRFQPNGVDGASLVVDPAGFEWAARGWRRPPLRGRVIYELHVGAFTPEGTFRAAIPRLDALAELGVNTIELMPLGDFTGRWNWGYDGVMIFAPARCYGTPDELRALIDAAHARGLAVITDVVYNHLGPVGNVLPAYSDHYFHRSRANPWGDSLNFDGPDAGPVRQFFLQNACMWFDEYRVDGLRLDAVHAIEDMTVPHIVADIASAAHARGGFVIAEDERNDARIVTPAAAGGWGADGMWADDFHHTVRVALTGQREAHFGNYSGRLAEWVETLRAGWLFRGQHYPGWNRPRGTSPDALSPEQFILCISNHDQVGNRPLGDRLHEMTSLDAYRAVSMLLCLVPHTPMLFMGQEWAARSPFPFFTDFAGKIGSDMAANRVKEFESRSASYPPDLLARMPDPQAESTFRSAKLDWAEPERRPHAGVRALYRACLRLRQANALFQSPAREMWRVARLGEHVMGLRWRDPAGDWLLLVTVAPGQHAVAGDELARPGQGGHWSPVLGSNEERFGGAVHIAPADPLTLRGPGAVLLREA